MSSSKRLNSSNLTSTNFMSTNLQKAERVESRLRALNNARNTLFKGSFNFEEKERRNKRVYDSMRSTDTFSVMMKQ